MKTNLSLLFSSLLIAGSAFAYIPASSVTKMQLPLYGVYTTSDATCKTGLIATVPLTATPQTINFASGGAIGSGTLPSTIGCVIIVIGNNLSNAWAAGTYTSSTSGTSDSSCNTGGNTTGQPICHGSSVTPTWPSQITTDAAAIGLTLQTASCASATTSSVIPLVLSTNSVCTGQTDADASTAACGTGDINNFALPTSTADAHFGTKLVAPSVSGDVNFVVNPSNTLGDDGHGCDNQKAPLFSFTAH